MSRILIVEDDGASRRLLEQLLTSGGYKVASARDGEDALRRLARGRFDLILLDVWMPRMSGLELLERLRKRKPRLRVIMVTADDTSTTLLHSMKRHATEFVRKPIDPDALLDLVRGVLERPPPPPIDVISARQDWVELLVPCTRAAAERVNDVVAHLDADLDPEVRESVGFAFRELLMNAVEWGGKLNPRRKVRVSYLRAARMVLYRIADPGLGFDLARLDHAAICHPADPTAHIERREAKNLRPGGFGLLMARESVDELIYNEKHNEVVFVKYLEGAPRSTGVR
ncbi:MAG TPA: response regulator [Myxococcota bacterium]|nr:response regulator [Myxococcota bacterium]